MIIQLLTTLALALSPLTGNTIAQTHESDSTVQETLQMPPLPAKATGTAFIVISKLDLKLRVYDRNEKGDTILVAEYPCCMGKNKGNKMKRGDMRTPESPAGKPFKITMIQDASTWRHDFKDGRGNIKAYGHWFLRLQTPGHSGIGIHGSTNNEKSVPGRASEGCIRLLDQDIITLKKHFAYVGMPVIIQGETQPQFEWELRARQGK
jgi:lipoprotein-anchoring transpeptidase ErfK/SrfK